jgi:hypothetical protein
MAMFSAVNNVVVLAEVLFHPGSMRKILGQQHMTSSLSGAKTLRA